MKFIEHVESIGSVWDRADGYKLRWVFLIISRKGTEWMVMRETKEEAMKEHAQIMGMLKQER